MNRNNTPTVLITTISLAVVGVIAIGQVFKNFILPRLPHRTSVMEAPAANLSADDFNQRGNELYDQKLFKRAATEYGHMIEKSPSDPAGYMLRGMAESEAGDYKAAIRDDTGGLDHARDTETRDALFFNRGLAYRNSGDFQHAVPDLTQAILLNANNWNAYEVRAFCYTSLGDFDHAIADYTVAIGQDPHPGTVFERGQAYLKKKEYQKALADLNRSLKDRPDFLAGYRLRADTYVALKQYDRAIEDAQSALRVENSATSRGGLGWYQYLGGKLPEAISNSQQAIQMDPKATFARFNLGLCYAAQGNADAAKTAYQDALQHSTPADVKAALQDVKDALSKQPNAPVLLQAQTQLQNAVPRAVPAS